MMSAAEVLSFGPYRLYPDSRLIEKDGVRMKLGSRALDILIVLARHSGNVVSAKELITRIWRGVIVSPGALRVQMNGLRKALGDGRNGVRYISNVTGLGYCFVAPIRVTSHIAQQAIPCKVDEAAALRVQELERQVQELQQMLWGRPPARHGGDRP